MSITVITVGGFSLPLTLPPTHAATVPPTTHPSTARHPQGRRPMDPTAGQGPAAGLTLAGFRISAPLATKLPAAVAEPGAPWQYQVRVMFDDGTKATCEMHLSEPITTEDDVHAVADTISTNDRRKVAAVEGFTRIAGPAEGQPRVPDADRDAYPWRYWVTGQSPGGYGWSCEVRRDKPITTAEDERVVTGMLAESVGMPVHDLTYSILSGR